MSFSTEDECWAKQSNKPGISVISIKDGQLAAENICILVWFILHTFEWNLPIRKQKQVASTCEAEVRCSGIFRSCGLLSSSCQETLAPRHDKVQRIAKWQPPQITNQSWEQSGKEEMEFHLNNHNWEWRWGWDTEIQKSCPCFPRKTYDQVEEIDIIKN